MQRGPKYASAEDEMFHKLMRRKWTLLIVSLFVLIIGMATFGICIWIR